MSLLHVEGLKKVYTTRFGGQQVEALRDVNFEVEEGEYVAIMGESGSGKTTLLNILAALDRPTAGSVLLDGKDLAGVRALITEPRILLADEPTGALDSRATDELLDLFGQINAAGQTILMVTHSVRAASRAGRVLFIKDGRVFHQIYRGEATSEQLYQKISDTLTMLQGGERA